MKKRGYFAVCMILVFLMVNLSFASSIYVNENGNVGIGTANPSGILHIEDSVSNYADGTKLIIQNSDASYWGRGDVSASIDFYKEDTRNAYIKVMHTRGDGGLHSCNDAGFVFGTSDGCSPAIDRFVITGDGAVGIGTTTPAASLHIEDSISNYTDGTTLIIQNSDTSRWGRGDVSASIDFYKEGTRNAYIKIAHTRGDATSTHSNNDAGIIFGTAHSSNPAEDRVVITSGGYMGINTMVPSYRLDVNGTIRGSNVSPSDVRWKTNINTIDNALEKVSKLRGVTYEWKDPEKGSGEQVGVVAQEVEDVFPQVVSTDNEGYKSVAYAKLVGPLIEAVKDLKIQNEMLAKKNGNLETENKKLQAQNITMEQKIDGILARLEKLEN